MTVKLIVIFHDFEGKTVKRAIGWVSDRAIINPVRAIARQFSAALFQTERDKVFTATFQWENTNVVDVYNYVPLSESKPDWVLETSYTTGD